MDFILLAAGNSTRYNTTRPKYWLTMYDGRFMIEHAIAPFRDKVKTIRIVIQQSHDEQYNVRHTLENIYGSQVDVTTIPMAPGHAMTAVSAMPAHDTPVIIKDCDSFFDVTLQPTNTICVVESTPDPAKSYVEVIDGKVISIKEKDVISDIACAGGYCFASSKAFARTVWDLVARRKGEIFVSHVIEEMIKTQSFNVTKVSNYVDVGAHDQFIEFNR
jgi:bifunctional N-acetylglucosamine-1-phosphate-uridyltransferase/glucosamine-1-phosphate-acetyltransferase GlmU-like protein